MSLRAARCLAFLLTPLFFFSCDPPLPSLSWVVWGALLQSGRSRGAFGKDPAVAWNAGIVGQGWQVLVAKGFPQAGRRTEGFQRPKPQSTPPNAR